MRQLPRIKRIKIDVRTYHNSSQNPPFLLRAENIATRSLCGRSAHIAWSEPEVFSRPHAVGFVDRNLTASPPQPHR